MNWVTLLLAFMLFSECSKKSSVSIQNNPEAYKNYILAYTAGMLKRNENIRIEFTKPVIVSDKINQDVDPTWYKITPSLKGSCVWTSLTSLEFTPDKSEIKGNQEFTFTLDLSHLFPEVEKAIRLIEIPFSYVPISLNYSWLFPRPEPVENNAMFLTGKIESNDRLDPSLLMESLKATVGPDNLELKTEITADPSNPLMYDIVIRHIPRSSKSTDLILKWHESVNNNNSKFESAKYKIPGIDDFEITGVDETDLNENLLTVYFSNFLNASQDIRGLIHIKGDSINLELIKEKDFIQVKLPDSWQKSDAILIVDKEIISENNKKLNSDFEFHFQVKPNAPQVRFVSKGSILPYTKDIVLPFEAINLHTIEVEVFKTYTNNVLYSFHLGFDNEYSSYNLVRLGKVIKQKIINLSELAPGNNEKDWKRYGLDLSELIESEPGAYYQVRIVFKPSYSNYYCDKEKPEIPEDFYQNETGDPNIKSLWRDYPYWHYSSDETENAYDVNNPCNIEYYSKEHFATTSFFASNIALSVKAGNDPGQTSAFVFDIIDGLPVKGAEIQYFDAQLQEISKLKTDGNGLAITAINTLPSFVMAKYKDHYAYLKINENRSLSQTEFDISGTKVQDGLKASIYTERGVWRPGDTVYLNAIIHDIQKELPEQFPVELSLSNPKGQKVFKEIKSSHLMGLYSYTIPIQSNAITGLYLATIKAGPSVFEKNILIETIKPNRYKVEWPGIESNGLDNVKNKTTLRASWLHGAPANGAFANVKWKYQLISPDFQKYKEFQFVDPVSSRVSGELELYNSNLNESGLADIKLPEWKNSSNTGKLKINLITKISDNSGEISTDYYEAQVSPIKELVGIKLPSDAQFKYLESGIEQEVKVIAIDSDGKPIANRKIGIELFKVEYQWWYELRNGNTGEYQNSNFKERALESTLTTDNNGLATLKMKLDEYNRYYIRAKNLSSGYLTGDFFYTGYGYNSDQKEFVNILSFKTDKEQYQVGESVALDLPGANQGYYIISLIRGSKIIDCKSITATKDKTKFNFKITNEMAPNIYLDISYVQGRSSKKNDLPLRMYGVVPVKIEDPNQKLNPIIKMNESLRTDEEFTIEISEQNGKEMAYQLFIVDEGLLNLTRFKTPNPYVDIMSKEALSILTWDNFNEVIGAMDGEMLKIFSVGGDEALQKASDEDKNKRFKPVVLKSSPSYLGKGGKQKQSFRISNYFGAVRVMVLCNSNKAFGAIDKSVKVINELMVQVTAPRVFAFNDELEIPVTVFARDPSIQNVNLKFEVTGSASLKSPATKSLQFKATGDQTVYYSIKGAGGIGNSNITVTANSGKYNSKAQVSLFVDNPNVITHEVKEYWIEAGKSIQEQIQPFGMEGTRDVKMEVSNIPGLSILSMIDKLLNYPHGCIEQTISAAFPQILINDLFELTTKQKEEANYNVQKAIEKLRLFQLADGSFSYWPGSPSYSDWGTSYAGHFMIEARKAGFRIPEDLIQNWYKFQKSKSNLSLKILKQTEYWYPTNYAYRLYTLALYGKPDWSGMNQLFLVKTENTFSKMLLAGAYALSGKKDIAESLLNQGPLEFKAYRDDFYNFGSDIRDQAMLVQVLVLLEKNQEALGLLNKIIKKSNSDYYSTQEQAMILISLSAISGKSKLGKMDFEYSWNANKAQIQTAKELFELKLEPASKQIFSIKNNSKRPIAVKIIQYGKDFIVSDQNSSKGLKMNVQLPKSGKALQIGDELEAVVVVTNNSNSGRLSNIALTTVFPSGFEIENRRIAGIEDDKTPVDYQDIRDDRVLSYFSLDQNQSIELRFNLTAAYPGNYIAPYFYCESMYDPSIYAKFRSGSYTIVPRK